MRSCRAKGFSRAISVMPRERWATAGLKSRRSLSCSMPRVAVRGDVVDGVGRCLGRINDDVAFIVLRNPHAVPSSLDNPCVARVGIGMSVVFLM